MWGMVLMPVDRFTTETQTANGLLIRASSFTWISSLKFGRRVMILLSIRLRLANKRLL
jgi:hypothetical protein